MATQTTRQAGQLVESDLSDQTTSKLAALQGVPVAPTSPAGTAALGASPDAAKMAGTGVQKAAVVQAAAQPTQDLATAQRQAAPSASNADEAAQAKAAQLSSLGSLGTRVQALIQKDLTLTQAPQGEQLLDQTKLNALTQDPGLKSQAEAALQKILANPQDQQAVADATNLWVQQGWGDISTFLPANYVSSAQDALGKTAAQNVAKNVKVGQVKLAPEEQQQLTAAFGDETWRDLTPEQMGQKIEDMRQAEFSRVSGIKAQLASATGAQREMLLRELQDAGQAGAEGTDQQVKELSQQVKAADTVTIGGEQHKVEDLMKDQTITDLVGRMLNDDQLAAKVGESNPEFAKWVADNKAGLQKLTGDVSQTTTAVKAVDQQKQDLGHSLGLSNDLLAKLVPDWNKVGTSVPDVSKVGVLAALQGADPTTKKQMSSAVSALAESDPAAFDKLSKLGATDVQHAWDYGQSVKNDQTGLYEQMGLSGAFITDPAAQQKMAKAKPAVDALNAVATKPGMSAIMNDPDHTLLDLIQTGQFQAKDAALLAKDPTLFQGFKDHQKTYAQLDKLQKAGDVQGTLDLVFGQHMDMAALNKEYSLAKQMALIEPNGDGGKKAAAFQANLDVNKDGKIDKADLAGITARMSLETGGQQSFDQYVTHPGASTTSLEKTFQDPAMKAPLDPTRMTGADFFTKMQSVLSDGKIDNDELTGMTPEERGKIYASKDLSSKIADKKLTSEADFQNYAAPAANSKAMAQGKKDADERVNNNLGGKLDEWTIYVASGNFLDPQKSHDLNATYTQLQTMHDAYAANGDRAGADGVAATLNKVKALIDSNTKVYLADVAKKDAAAKAKQNQWADPTYHQRTPGGIVADAPQNLAKTVGKAFTDTTGSTEKKLKGLGKK